MEENVKTLCEWLPTSWRSALLSLPNSVQNAVRELRIRTGRPLTLSLAHENVMLPLVVSQAETEACFLRFCGHAVHTHQDELAQGFVTTENGWRVGVAGRAVCKDGRVVSYRDISSLCVRIARPYIACAAPLMPFLLDGGHAQSLLLCGAPSVGKTTVLRDVARRLSERCNVAVVDERRELFASSLAGCDVLSGCPKAEGILQAVRTLSPDAVVVDELGGDAQWDAVATSCFLGVPIIASVHADTVQDVAARERIMRLLRDGGFKRIALLPPRYAWETATRIWKAGDFLEGDWDRADRVYLHGDRDRHGVADEGA